MTEIGGFYSRLADGLSRTGVSVTTYGLSSHPFGYDVSPRRTPVIVDWSERWNKRSQNIPKNRIVGRVGASSLAKLLRLALFLWAMTNHDAFVFVFGTSLLPMNADLPILRLFRRRVIAVLGNGSEARPPYINGVFLDSREKSLSIQQYARLSTKMRQRILRFERFANVIVGAPLTAQFFSKPFVNWFSLGIPIQITTAHSSSGTQVDSTENGASSAVRILHAPSNPAFKGTRRIRDAVEALKQAGHQIEYIEIVRQPNRVVMEQLDRCDFVVDQVYSDSPLAGLATEAAAYGKPAVVGGYGWDELRANIDQESWPPSEICHPDSIQTAIERLIKNKDYRVRLGQQAQDFVSTFWNVDTVASKYLHLIEGPAPKGWMCDPRTIYYVYGGGLPAPTSQRILRRIVDRCGARGLALSHNPVLEKRFVDFAEQAVD